MIAIAQYFTNKWRQRATGTGHFMAAKQMRKQGIPIEMALLILFGERK